VADVDREYLQDEDRSSKLSDSMAIWESDRGVRRGGRHAFPAGRSIWPFVAVASHLCYRYGVEGWSLLTDVVRPAEFRLGGRAGATQHAYSSSHESGCATVSGQGLHARGCPAPTSGLTGRMRLIGFSLGDDTDSAGGKIKLTVALRSVCPAAGCGAFGVRRYALGTGR